MSLYEEQTQFCSWLAFGVLSGTWGGREGFSVALIIHWSVFISPMVTLYLGCPGNFSILIQRYYNLKEVPIPL